MLNKDYKYYLPATDLIPSGMAVAPINKRYPATIASLSGVEPSFSISVDELKRNRDLLENTFGLITIKHQVSGRVVASLLYGFSSYPYFLKIMSLIQYAGKTKLQLSVESYIADNNESYCFSSFDMDKLMIKLPPFKGRSLSVSLGARIFLPSYIVYYLSSFGVVDSVPLPIVSISFNMQPDKLKILSFTVHKFNILDKQQVASILAKASFFRDPVMLRYMQWMSTKCDNSVLFYNKFINDMALN